MESTQKLDIVRLIDLKKEELGSYNLVAKKLNISAGTISNMRFNKWDLISSDKWIEVAKQLGATTSTIWQISPQTRDYKHLMLLLDRVRESCSFQIICERAGGCKTTGLKAYANQHQNNSSTPVYYMSAREWGSKRFMQELATTIGCRWFHKDTADAILTKVINHIELEVNQKLTEKGQRDYKLIKLALNQGDQYAYAELMNHYRDSLYFTMLKMTGDQHDADDLTIEAFGKAFKNLSQYTSEYAFSTWLFKIATNNCIDFVRKKHKKNMTIMTGLEAETVQDTIRDSRPDPEEQYIIDQKISLMREVVQKLKPHYKKLIEMRYFKELSYEEIAVELNLPLGTVKAQLFRSREFLFNVMKNAKERI